MANQATLFLFWTHCSGRRMLHSNLNSFINLGFFQFHSSPPKHTPPVANHQLTGSHEPSVHCSFHHFFPRSAPTPLITFSLFVPLSLFILL